mmetsp:Transcript_9184/g.11788  ORF Transcript_9184/g.11788 Transcript_9184/m.11788 type:complete len:412 (+) Transcript_9184:50-1285(+)
MVRRVLLTNAAAQIAIRRRRSILLTEIQKRRRRRVIKQPKRRKQLQQFSWEDHVLSMPPGHFQKAYRLTEEAFNDLHAALESQLSACSLQATRARGYPIDSRVRLASALRFLCGGQTIDLCMLYKISRTECYHSVWMAVDAINSHFSIVFPIKDRAKLEKLESEFAAHSRSHVWRGQVAPVDGIDFKTISPGVAVPNPGEYYVERKSAFSILCIATCDYHRRFLSYDMTMGPRSHDSLAWRKSDLGHAVMNGALGPDLFISGDAAFPQVPGMVVPSTEPGSDDFNFEQSSMRMPIECAFGILVRRFGIFWRPLAVRADRRTKVIECCMKLHNYCIDRRIELSLRELSGMTEILPGRWARTPVFDRDGRPVEYLTSRRDSTHQSHVHNAAQKRLMRAIQVAGLKRPPRRKRK